MAKPTLSPASATSAVILTATGSTAITGNGAANVNHYPFGIYAAPDSSLYDTNFINGASDQVAYTYKKLGGDILDIELTVGNIYASYEEAVLEYSYQINIHQAKNVLSDLLGMSTGSFNHDGEMTEGATQGVQANLAFPRYKFSYAQRVADGLAEEAGVGGNLTEYSASFDIVAGQQDYDLQTIISSSSTESNTPYGIDMLQKTGGSLTANQQDRMNRKFKIRRVFYKTPASVWRFYGYYGGLNVVGNMNYYGQFADDTTFEIIPAWHNKLQAMAFEDHLYTRLSHYSFEVHNNKLRLFPIPHATIPKTFWVTFTTHLDAWEEEEGRKTGVEGINNMNTLPFPNLPYKYINSIGKQWIRRYALALTKEMLGQVRGKFGSIPIPGESVTLNASELLGQAKAEQDALKEELKTVLDQMTYVALAEQDAKMVAAIDTVYQEIPLPIYQG